ncbi:mycothiol transferase [Luteococcus sp. Sow4_B9]|uniref:mycothiol transferase n=1 Tax=Luteococcus sp. Sow4_B9 TaxID=3438792 RepID=UPI003F9CE4CD
MATDRILLEFTLGKFDELFALIGGVDDETANRRPDLEGANSLYGIGTHVLGMMRYWSCTTNRGVEVERDREGEFSASGSVAELLERAAVERERFETDVRSVDDHAVPANKPAGRIEPWLVSCHGVLMHVFEEVCQHLGHAEVTRDLLASGR